MSNQEREGMDQIPAHEVDDTQREQPPVEKPSAPTTPVDSDPNAQ